ncbi:MAG: hypothetical protein DRN24_00930 [Thermoplasmata archaeon]|nr:MAG: hypothetical protein DRN24_00930 [Thermoplasmata archaeon]
MRDIFLNTTCNILYKGGFLTIKRENCPFCGHRWIRSSQESPVTCPNCKMKFFPQEELSEKK